MVETPYQIHCNFWVGAGASNFNVFITVSEFALWGFHESFEALSRVRPNSADSDLGELGPFDRQKSESLKMARAHSPALVRLGENNPGLY